MQILALTICNQIRADATDCLFVHLWKKTVNIALRCFNVRFLPKISFLKRKWKPCLLLPYQSRWFQVRKIITKIYLKINSNFIYILFFICISVISSIVLGFNAGGWVYLIVKVAVSYKINQVIAGLTIK